MSLIYFLSATFAQHLAGEVYTQTIAEHSNYVTQMTISGEATGTGKSLFQSIWIRTFKGESKTSFTSISEAQAYEMLSRGENIYGKYILFKLYKCVSCFIQAELS